MKPAPESDITRDVCSGRCRSPFSYLSATTLLAAVLDRYGTDPRSFGATFWIPGVKTERTAKKRRTNEQKWARYSHLKRVRAADLFLMDRYESHRAMFEAYSRNKYNATGLIQWMLNSAWPSNMW